MLTAITIALAATFLAKHQGGPQLPYALFFGMALNFAAEGEKIRNGIEVASRQILRFGVALLGARITAKQLTGLGIESIAMVAGGVRGDDPLRRGSWGGRARRSTAPSIAVLE